MTGTSIRSYQDLLIWQRGMDIVEAVYRLSATLPSDEKYGLSSQLRRAAVSIPANIAEGHGREMPGSFVQHLRIAQGSLKELETLILALQRIGLGREEQRGALLDHCGELGRMLRSMIRSIQEREP